VLVICTRAMISGSLLEMRDSAISTAVAETPDDLGHIVDVYCGIARYAGHIDLGEAAVARVFIVFAVIASRDEEEPVLWTK
jgi:hypothetical protein